MSSSTVDARPPATVNVPEGDASVTFEIITGGVSNPSEILITAAYAGQSRSFQIRLIGPARGEEPELPPVVPPDVPPVIPPVIPPIAPTASFNLSSSLAPYAMLGGSAVTCTSSTVVGDVGVSPLTAITGFLPARTSGTSGLLNRRQLKPTWCRSMAASLSPACQSVAT